MENNTATRLEIKLEARPRIIHTRRVTYVKWDNVILVLMALIFLLIMAFSHVEVEDSDPHAEESAQFYAQMEADHKWNNYLDEKEKEAEARAEEKAEAEKKAENERKRIEHMQKLEQETKNSSSGTYVPSM